MMPNLYLRFLVLAFLCSALQAAQATRGATIPWTTYEAEDMTLSSSTIVGPPGLAPDKNSALTNSVDMESSGRRCVRLNAAGSSVQFTAQAAANAIVVRYCLPDSANGVGLDSTLSLYVNGSQVATLPVTSRYSWRYGSYTFTNTPGDGKPRNVYDEVRLAGLTIPQNATVRIQKTAADTAGSCVVDLVDLENIPGPLSQPANTLAVTTYGADTTGAADATIAFQNCINAARTQGKNVWIPVGNYLIAGDLNNIQELAISGAGMWYSTLVGDPNQYNSNAAKRIRFNGGGNNIHLADFAVFGKLNYRNDGEANDGFSEFYGTGSTISRVWIEHTKAGAWIANSSGLVIDGCRIRNTIADGINFCVGVRSSTIQNCTARGCGDDAFAIWPATYATATYAPGLNVIKNCTAALNSLGSGFAVYGGDSNAITDNVAQDIPYGCGILVSGTFPIGSNLFAGTTQVRRCDVDRAGGFDSGWNAWRAAVTICPQNIDIAGLALSDLVIRDSLSYAVEIVNPGGSKTLSNASFDNVTITTFGTGVPLASVSPYVDGVYGVWARSDAKGGISVSNLTVNGSTITALPASGSLLKNQSSNFIFTFGGGGGTAPTITNSALTLSGTVGQPIASYQITATQSPTSYNATGLPAGVSINTTTGAITGTPTAAGTSNVTISATNATGIGSATLVITVAAATAAPVITSSLTAAGTVGQSFTYQIVGSHTPTSYNATGLPAGVSVNTTTGAITGNLTAAGTANVTISATNATGTGSATLVITTSSSGSSSTAVSINAGGGSVGSFVADVNFTNGATFSDTTQTIDVSATNAAPAAVYQTQRYGAFSYTIAGLTANGSYTVRLYFAEIYFSTIGSRVFNVAINGTAALSSFDILQQPGVVKNKAVVKDLAATATSGGNIVIAFTAITENPEVSGIQVLTSTGGAAPAITSTLTANGTTGQAFSYQIVGSNTPTSYNATGLPAGLSVNTTTGAITGTPTTAGTTNVTISATNAIGTGSATLVITISAAGTTPPSTNSPKETSGKCGLGGFAASVLLLLVAMSRFMVSGAATEVRQHDQGAET